MYVYVRILRPSHIIGLYLNNVMHRETKNAKQEEEEDADRILASSHHFQPPAAPWLLLFPSNSHPSF